MNISIEQVEKLQARANVSYEEAKNALEECDNDILEALILLEKQGKTTKPNNGGAYSTNNENVNMGSVQVQTYGANNGNTNGGNHYNGGQQNGNRAYEDETASFGDQMNKLWKAFLKLVHKGNINKFEVYRYDRNVITVPVNILILALIFFFWITLPALVIGLFFNCRYRFRGPNLGKDSINNVMDSASETAENLKKSAMESNENAKAENQESAQNTTQNSAQDTAENSEPAGDEPTDKE